MQIKHNSSNGNKGVGRVSVGPRELQILRYITNSAGQVFNKRKCARDLSIPRSTVYDILDRLQAKGLIKIDQHKIQVTSQGSSCIEYRPSKHTRKDPDNPTENLSMHYTRYKFKIKNQARFRPDRLKELQPNGTDSNTMTNWTQYFAYFDDATIIVNTNHIIIRVRDILSSDAEKAHYKSFRIAIQYIQRLKGIGIIGEGIQLERAHYARVQSYLSEFLLRVDERYYLDLGDGHMFWVDNSPTPKHPEGKKEDETDSLEYRSRLDEFMQDLNYSESSMTDVDKMKEVMSMFIRLEYMKQTGSHHMVPQPDLERPDYFG